MANVAIQIKVGSHPDNYNKGMKYYFSVGGENTKISSEELLEVLCQAMENAVKEKYGDIKGLVNLGEKQ